MVLALRCAGWWWTARPKPSRRHAIAAWMRNRSGEAKDEVLRITGEVADLADASASEAERVVRNARRWLADHPDAPKRRRVARLVDDLEALAVLTGSLVVVVSQSAAGGGEATRKVTSLRASPSTDWATQDVRVTRPELAYEIVLLAHADFAVDRPVGRDREERVRLVTGSIDHCVAWILLEERGLR